MNHQRSLNSRSIQKMSLPGRLEVVEPGSASDSMADSSSSSRPASSSSRKAPPVNKYGSRPGSQNSTREVTTPVREQKLISARRVTNTQSDFDAPHDTMMNSLSLNDDMENELLALTSLDSGPTLTGSSRSRDTQAQSQRWRAPKNENTDSTAEPPATNGYAGDKQSHDSSSESDEDDSGDDDEERTEAPNELILEFLQCVMNKDLDNALKLCRMILLYEPGNKRALEFLPLLEERKLQADERADCNSSEDSSDDDDDDDDDDSDDDSNSDTESESESEEDDDDNRSSDKSSTLVAKDNGKPWAPVAR